MVAAGVYLVARMFPLFEMSETAMLVVTSVGLLTALMAGTMSLVMTDLKRILAYSTVSHLGLMVMTLGAGGFVAAMFHLIVHAFAKAMLFLSAGSVSHGTGKLDVRDMGGLARRMPLTALCFTVGAMALAGLPPLSGFFSKDEVLLAVWEGRHPVFLALALVAVFLSALYMARVLFRVFLGPLKPGNETAHESPPAMLAPMLVFAFVSVTLGFLALPYSDAYHGSGLLPPPGRHGGPRLPVQLVPGGGLPGPWPSARSRWHGLTYVRGRISPDRVAQRIAPLIRLWERAYYLDDLYQWGIDRVVLATGKWVALFDRIVVNDVGVNRTAQSIAESGQRLRYHVTGKLYNYALVMTGGVLLLALLWWLAVR